MTKFYESNILTVAKIVSHEPLKLVIPISRFPKKNILAYTEECKISLNCIDSKLVITLKKDVISW